MNRNENNDFQSKNHYADFDKHGNPLTGNTHSLSHYNPSGAYSGYGNRDEQESRSRDTNAAHAYGDMSRGTSYGEGGSRQRGGSSYGHSYYGMSGNEGPRMTQHDRNWEDSRRHDAYGDNAHYRGRGHRFSDSFGRTSDGGYVHENRPQGNMNPGRYHDSYQGGQYRNSDREIDRGYEDYVLQQTYRRESRDRNRDSIDYSNRGYMNEGWRSREEEERYTEDRNRGRYDRNRRW